MAKRTRSSELPTDPATGTRTGGAGQKRRKRLERALAILVAAEARRVARLEKIRAKAAELRSELAALDARAAPAPETMGREPSLPGPTGYCMREHRRVTIGGFAARTLANGRTLIIGACASCGGRVTALAARAAVTRA
jgi:hypothetical protein